MIVVPTFAPMITPIDWLKLSSPAVTNPTIITVVTDDDWMTAVTRAPAKAALKRLVVSFANRRFILPPAATFSDSVILRMPYRNSASPPPIPVSKAP